MAADHPSRYPQVPAATVTVGMWLFLASLFMLFAAGLLGYVVIRNSVQNVNQHVHLPGILWLSTAMVLGVSIALARALGALRRERRPAFLAWVRISLLLALGFLAVQAPAMVMLLAQHRGLKQQHVALYGLVFFLILLHALHVVGGMVALILINLRGSRGVYDHEHYLPMRHAAMYWHFLDAVWIILFLTFLATA
jgi:heme/copper-type cytochrome/quinol oxidase subunit 3